MPYLFTCPHCQTKTQVDDRYSGQAGQCVTCGGRIELPRFSSGPDQTTLERGGKSIGWIVAGTVLLILLTCLVIAVVRSGGATMTRLTTGRDRAASISNLEKIAAALNAYAADHGTYPQPATRDSKGTRLHSWRVLILPYLGEEELYDQFNLDAPWDDPDNMRMGFEVPSVYRHPNASAIGMYSESAYYLIVGPGTLFPKTGPLGLDQITDDPSQTLLVVEGWPLIASSQWTEPVDLDFLAMSGKINGTAGLVSNEPGGLLDGGAAMVTADERGHFVPDTIAPTVFQALVTPRGKERLPDDTLD